MIILYKSDDLQPAAVQSPKLARTLKRPAEDPMYTSGTSATARDVKRPKISQSKASIAPKNVYSDSLPPQEIFYPSKSSLRPNHTLGPVTYQHTGTQYYDELRADPGRLTNEQDKRLEIVEEQLERAPVGDLVSSDNDAKRLDPVEEHFNAAMEHHSRGKEEDKEIVYVKADLEILFAVTGDLREAAKSVSEEFQAAKNRIEKLETRLTTVEKNFKELDERDRRLGGNPERERFPVTVEGNKSPEEMLESIEQLQEQAVYRHDDCRSQGESPKRTTEETNNKNRELEGELKEWCCKSGMDLGLQHDKAAKHSKEFRVRWFFGW